MRFEPRSDSCGYERTTKSITTQSPILLFFMRSREAYTRPPFSFFFSVPGNDEQKSKGTVPPFDWFSLTLAEWSAVYGSTKLCSLLFVLVNRGFKYDPSLLGTYR